MKKHSEKKWISETAYWPDDPVSGTRIVQLTGIVSMATNIYCEDPACSPQNRIAVFRTMKIGCPGELWIVDINERLSVRIDDGVDWVGSCPQSYGDFFFYPRLKKDKWEMVRLCFSTLETEVVYLFPEKKIFTTLGSASCDGRYIVNQRTPAENEYQVVVIDIETGKETIIISGADFCNPHPRFDRINGKWILIQKNYGYRRVGRYVRKVYPDATVTLNICSRDGKEKIDAPVAKPFIPCGVSGHEAWLKKQEAFIYSSSCLDQPYEDGNKSGNLLFYKFGGEKPQVITHAPELYFGHVSTSSCGRYWCCDVWYWKHAASDVCNCAPRIAIGSIKTGKFAFVCEVGGFWPNYEIGHSHPYLSSDSKYVIFTSTRTGFPQVFLAELPEGFLEKLE